MSDRVSHLKAVLVFGFRLAASACGGGNGDAPNSGDGTATEVAELVLELSIGDDLAAAEVVRSMGGMTTWKSGCER